MPDPYISTRPLHLQLREILIRRIADGEWRAGDAIPNEIDLAREFGLSAGTVRKALDWMESAQLVSRQQGRGTFVRDQTSSEALTRFSSFRNADGSLIDDTITEPVHTAGEANSAEAAHLRLNGQDAVHRIEQTRLVGGEPFACEHLVLPATMFPKVGAATGGVRSIGETAFANGLLLSNGRETVTIGGAPQAAAQRLRIGEGTAVLVLDRVIEAIDGRPAEWRRSWCNIKSRIYLSRLG